MTTNTILNHIAEGIERGEPVDLDKFFTADEKQTVAAAFNTHGAFALSPVFESLGGKIDYGRLRIFRAAMNSRRTEPS